MQFGPTNRVGSKKGCYTLVVSEHLGFGSDLLIGWDRKRGATFNDILVIYTKCFTIKFFQFSSRVCYMQQLLFMDLFSYKILTYSLMLSTIVKLNILNGFKSKLDVF